MHLWSSESAGDWWFYATNKSLAKLLSLIQMHKSQVNTPKVKQKGKEKRHYVIWILQLQQIKHMKLNIFDFAILFI